MDILQKDNSFIVIHDFMRTKLGLKGSELLVYAVIYGFSQDGKSWYHGGYKYLNSWTGNSKRNLQRVTDSLVNKGLIVKTQKYHKKKRRNVMVMQAVLPISVTPQSKNPSFALSENSYITILKFMQSELGLSGAKLLTYAIIHGFSQAKENKCTASLNYFAAWTGVTVDHARRTLNDFIANGLIDEIDETVNGESRVSYRTIPLTDCRLSINKNQNEDIKHTKTTPGGVTFPQEKVTSPQVGVTKCRQQGDKISEMGDKMSRRGDKMSENSDKMSPMYNNNNIYNNKINNIKRISYPTKSDDGNITLRKDSVRQETPMRDVSQPSKEQSAPFDRVGYSLSNKNEEDSKKQKKPQVPNLKEVENYVKSIDDSTYLLLSARSFYKYYNDKDWRDVTGKVVKDWESALLAWLKRDYSYHDPSMKDPDYVDKKKAEAEKWSRLAWEEIKDYVVHIPVKPKKINNVNPGIGDIVTDPNFTEDMLKLGQMFSECANGQGREVIKTREQAVIDCKKEGCHKVPYVGMGDFDDPDEGLALYVKEIRAGKYPPLKDELARECAMRVMENENCTFKELGEDAKEWLLPKEDLEKYLKEKERIERIEREFDKVMDEEAMRCEFKANTKERTLQYLQGLGKGKYPIPPDDVKVHYLKKIKQYGFNPDELNVTDKLKLDNPKLLQKKRDNVSKFSKPSKNKDVKPSGGEIHPLLEGLFDESEPQTYISPEEVMIQQKKEGLYKTNNTENTGGLKEYIGEIKAGKYPPIADDEIKKHYLHLLDVFGYTPEELGAEEILRV